VERVVIFEDVFLVVGLDERGLVRNIDGASENVDSTKEMNLSQFNFTDRQAE
jgi:hypothetical protein